MYQEAIPLYYLKGVKFAIVSQLTKLSPKIIQQRKKLSNMPNLDILLVRYKN